MLCVSPSKPSIFAVLEGGLIAEDLRLVKQIVM